MQEGDEFVVQYSRYEEGERELFGERSKYQPIRVDNLNLSGQVSLGPLSLFANYVQDVWSGATPIATMPLAFAGNRGRDAGGESISGASPIIDGSLLLDSEFNPYRIDPGTGNPVKETRLVHTISSASPEIREQGDLRLGYGWDDNALEVGIGVSQEPDYKSRFYSLGARRDFNRRATTLKLDLSYTDSQVAAILDPDAVSYIDTSAYRSQIEISRSRAGQIDRTLHGDRNDWSARVGLTQVMSRDSLLETSLRYIGSRGFMENPYKVAEFVFVRPRETPFDFGVPGVPPLFSATVRAVLEQLPDSRNQWIWGTRYVQYLDDWDASLHLSTHVYRDDWGVNAMTLDGAWTQPLGRGWTVTPSLRYYTQNAAEFYRPYFLFLGGEPRTPAKPPDYISNIDFSRISLKDYSSDQRLSAFGALSAGLTVSKSLVKGVGVEAGVEYYAHRGSLKLGGGGEGDYADFDSLLVNFALRVDESAIPVSAGHGHLQHARDRSGKDPDVSEHPESDPHAAPAPAGVVAAHRLHRAGELMVGYRLMAGAQSGDTLHGTSAVPDAAIVADACWRRGCSLTASSHRMTMQMLELMFAPTDWLTLMLMPQFVDMEMRMRPLADAPSLPAASHHHTSGRDHVTGGIGDTGLYALIGLFDNPGHRLQLGMGLGVPTGDVDLRLGNTRNGELFDYGMQLGSGTWDLLPSLTYTGDSRRWSWGGQLNGALRIDDRNRSGYSLGEIFQGTAWGSYRLNDWLWASVRGVYTKQGHIRGAFDGPHSRSSPPDFPWNYGGRFWDLGLGFDAVIASGMFKGNRIGIELLKPIVEDVSGYQLKREGAVFLAWDVGF